MPIVKQAHSANLSSFKKTLVVAALLGALTLLGCQESDDPRRIHVEGSITLNGKPIENGKISFTPDSQAGNKGPMGVCKIKKGKYTTNSLGGRGVVGGHHIVEIENFGAPPANVNQVADSSGINEGGIDPNSAKLRKRRSSQGYLEDWDIPVNEPLIHRDFNIEK